MKKYSGIILLFIAVHINCHSQAIKQPSKINGVSFVAPPQEIYINDINRPKEVLSANYLSIMPYAFIPEGGTGLKYNSKWQWWGEKEVGTIKTIAMAKDAGYSVMLKPHVWKRHGSYTGHHKYEKEVDWKAFEKSFSTYILRYAQIADSLNVELFCIGTEWEQFALQRPNFWYKLIKDVRSVYNGKLTYAANWDEYKRISFWKQLDFIGVDAYFPLSDATTPKVKELENALQPYLKELKKVSETNDKPIIFTEYGYRSRDNTAEKPWESNREGVTVNLEAQINAYQAFFNVFWEQTFIQGGFVWKWFANHENSGGKENNGFTPQNKPVEKVIQAKYGKGS